LAATLSIALRMSLPLSRARSTCPFVNSVTSAISCSPIERLRSWNNSTSTLRAIPFRMCATFPILSSA